MRKFLLFMFAPFLLICAAGCSNDDDQVTVVYRLLDKNGQECNVFNIGDDMTFEFFIINSTNHELKLEENYPFFVYDSNGNIVNSPGSDVLMLRFWTIAPGEKYGGKYNWQWDYFPLSKGSYQAICNLDLEELSEKTYYINFEIK